MVRCDAMRRYDAPTDSPLSNALPSFQDSDCLTSSTLRFETTIPIFFNALRSTCSECDGDVSKQRDAAGCEKGQQDLRRQKAATKVAQNLAQCM